MLFKSQTKENCTIFLFVFGCGTITYKKRQSTLGTDHCFLEGEGQISTQQKLLKKNLCKGAIKFLQLLPSKQVMHKLRVRKNINNSQNDPTVPILSPRPSHPVKSNDLPLVFHTLLCRSTMECCEQNYFL